ncbi:MAG: translation initiation factor IF-2 associated domain-containing protein, partial [Pseudomonadota bacterium]
MSKVTVSQLAEVLGVTVDKLLDQLNQAGIEAGSGDEAVSNDDKKKLLAHLRASHGKAESDATAPRQVTLKRRSHSELRIQGSGPRATTKTVNVEFRKKRTYVKRDALQEHQAEDSEREAARKALEESRAQREAEAQAEKDAQEARQRQEA